MLVASELVTNSVRAVAGLIDVALTVTGDREALSVTDGADGSRATRHPPLADPQRRGLASVGGIAAEWPRPILARRRSPRRAPGGGGTSTRGHRRRDRSGRPGPKVSGGGLRTRQPERCSLEHDIVDRGSEAPCAAHG